MTRRFPPPFGEALAQAAALVASASPPLSQRADAPALRLASGAGAVQAVLPYPLVVPVWSVVTVSETNAHEHWRARQRRAKAQRQAVAASLFEYRDRLRQAGNEVLNHGGRVLVTLTRIAPRRLDDDNLRGALKACRDEVAAGFGVDDGHDGIDWECIQRRGEPAVLVDIRPALPC